MYAKNPYYTQQQLKQQSKSPSNQGPNYSPQVQNQQQPFFSNSNNNQSQPWMSNQNNNSNRNNHQNYNQNMNNYPPIRNNMPPPNVHPEYHNQNRMPIPQTSPNIVVTNRPAANNLMSCQFCRQMTQTYMVQKSGAFVWLMCFIIMLLTCCCWWIAFFVDGWKDKQFRCSRCNNVKNVELGGCF